MYPVDSGPRLCVTDGAACRRCHMAGVGDLSPLGLLIPCESVQRSLRQGQMYRVYIDAVTTTVALKGTHS